MRTHHLKSLSHYKSAIVLLLSVSTLISIGCSHSHAATQDIPMSTVMEAVRDYGKGHVPASASRAIMLPEPPIGKSNRRFENPYAFHTPLAQQLEQGDFDQLERDAAFGRIEQPKFYGGVWVLYQFYDGLGTPLVGPAPGDWDTHIALLNKWIAARPESPTPLIALAETYIKRAWKARGTEYADSVTESGWGSFAENLALAKSTLMQAAKLKEKCPFWYEAMQAVALGGGWNKKQARELFDQAVAFEPAYPIYYREYANYLLPKWYGEEGETQAFAEEMMKKLSEPDASIIYYEIAGIVAIQYDEEQDSLTGLLWPKVKQGYAALVRRDGTDSLKLNRFAYMAFLAKDKAAAHDSFTEIGDDWNGKVWSSQQTFETARAWALNP